MRQNFYKNNQNIKIDLVQFINTKIRKVMRLGNGESHKKLNHHNLHTYKQAVYIKSLPNYKPHLVYVDEENYTIFNQDNCYELSPEGLKYFFNKYIQINVRRQEMLRMADGDIKKLAMMIGIDWSEIRNRENNPILNTIQDEDIQKLEEFYDSL